MKITKDNLEPANIDRMIGNALSPTELQGRKVGREFFLRPPDEAARELLGKMLVRRFPGGESISAEIIETEAYLAEGDPASHSFTGMTERNKAMFAPGGTLYVYIIYGIHNCFNFVTEEEGRGSAVLIRAGRPAGGIRKMMELRGKDTEKDLLTGPGNFAKAFAIEKSDSGKDLLGNEIFVADYKTYRPEDIIAGPRVGISKAKDLNLRFTIKGLR